MDNHLIQNLIYPSLLKSNFSKVLLEIHIGRTLSATDEMKCLSMSQIKFTANKKTHLFELVLESYSKSNR